MWQERIFSYRQLIIGNISSWLNELEQKHRISTLRLVALGKDKVLAVVETHAYDYEQFYTGWEEVAEQAFGEADLSILGKEEGLAGCGPRQEATPSVEE